MASMASVASIWQLWQVWQVCGKYGKYGMYGKYGKCGKCGKWSVVTANLQVDQDGALGADLLRGGLDLCSALWEVLPFREAQLCHIRQARQ